MTDVSATAVLWFRRDLRLVDHPAIADAARRNDQVVPMFVVDDRLWRASGAARLVFLVECLRRLDDDLGGRLVIRTGDPAVEVPAVAREVGAREVTVTEDFGPYGVRRDEAVERALEADRVGFRRVGSPYAVNPGTVTTQAGQFFKVFTPFFRAWGRHTGEAPLAVSAVDWLVGPATDPLPEPPRPAAQLPAAGERAALDRLESFLAGSLEDYAEHRDDPATDGTTRLSPYLKFGCIHPRQVLTALDGSVATAGPSVEKLRAEVAWREFYADVLYHRPETARRSFHPKMGTMRTNAGPSTDERFEAWRNGRTGFPLVDAGMRQLAAQAWMHNRVRMVVASFLVKDLHIDWTRGAAVFMELLVDGDLASNQHGWQWVAGTGTDAAPYFRVFNPVAQSKKFDPTGAYLRRWVPELGDLGAPMIHEPWRLPGGPPPGYPAPIVDHGVERVEALRRYDELR